MTDKIQNDDEYQFADLDTMGSDLDNDESGFNASGSKGVPLGEAPKKDVRRNALIVLAVVVVIMVLYKFLGSLFHKDVAAIKSSQQVTPVVQAPPIVPAETPLTQVQSPPSPDLTNITQKLSDMEAGQQSLRSDISSLNSQLGTINENINSLNNKMATLNQSLLALSGRLDQQSGELARLIAMQNKPKPIPVARRQVSRPRMQYSVQAIIPGRAWLIAQNGSTLTVREGTVIPGVGTVRLIDPNQGRVVMSTGQVIRFSQQDS